MKKKAKREKGRGMHQQIRSDQRTTLRATTDAQTNNRKQQSNEHKKRNEKNRELRMTSGRQREGKGAASVEAL